jgi:hypothetical protein
MLELGSIIQSKDINSGNGFISSEIGRGDQDLFYPLYFHLRWIPYIFPGVEIRNQNYCCGQIMSEPLNIQEKEYQVLDFPSVRIS